MDQPSEHERLKTCLREWDETCNAEDAAVLLTTMREHPHLAQTPFGKAAKQLAFRKIRGTEWMRVFEPEEIHQMRIAELTARAKGDLESAGDILRRMGFAEKKWFGEREEN